MIHEIGLAFTLAACGGYLWSNVDPCWKKTSGDFNVQPYDICYGLYKSCTITSVKEWLCDNNLSETPLDLAIPARNHYCRAAVIIGTILTAASLLLGGFSSDCCRVGDISDSQKRKYRTWTGWILLIACVMPASAAAWTTHVIIQERYWYRATNTPGLKYTINRGVYITFGSALLSLFASLCFSVLSDNGCCNSGQEDEKEMYRYEPHLSPKIGKLRRKSSAIEYV